MSKFLSFLSHSPFTFCLDGVLSPDLTQKNMKKMRISIENPCHEDWQKMTPETQGRFCGACEKTVVDFSEMSDAEILLYFSKPKIEKVCGRFRPEQLSPSGESATPRFEESIVSPKMPSYRVQPSKQLLHFAYLLVMVTLCCWCFYCCFYCWWCWCRSCFRCFIWFCLGCSLTIL